MKVFERKQKEEGKSLNFFLFIFFPFSFFFRSVQGDSSSAQAELCQARDESGSCVYLWSSPGVAKKTGGNCDRS